MADDDEAVMARLAALEAEVKADADAQAKRKEAALAKLRAEKAKKEAEAAAAAPAPSPQRALVKRKAAPVRDDAEDDGDDSGGDISSALELAGKASRVHKELAKPTGKGGKSWMASGLASLVLGPIGWLYAGSMREAIPASVGWVAFVTLASKILPSVLLTPVLLVVMPLSAIAGVVYAMQFNRNGKRQRLFNKDKKALPPARGR